MLEQAHLDDDDTQLGDQEPVAEMDSCPAGLLGRQGVPPARKAKGLVRVELDLDLVDIAEDSIELGFQRPGEHRRADGLNTAHLGCHDQGYLLRSRDYSADNISTPQEGEFISGLDINITDINCQKDLSGDYCYNLCQR